MSQSLYRAWRYYFAIEGMNLAAESIGRLRLLPYADALNEALRATWDALFSVVGTLFDRTKGTHSFPSLLAAARKAKVATASTLGVYERLARGKPLPGPLQKLLHLRHKATAHWTPEARDESFWQDNRVALEEVERVLEDVERHVNTIAMQAGRMPTEVRGDRQQLASQWRELLSRIP